MRFYEMGYGWATRYIWFSIEEQVYKGFDFVRHIKDHDFTITIDKGNIEADCHGSTTAIKFYSEKAVEILKESAGMVFDSIEVNKSRNINGKYYYIEIHDGLPRIQNEDIFKEPDLIKYRESVRGTETDIVSIGSDICPMYTDIGKWNGSKMVTVKGTWLHVVTEDLKKTLEHRKLKNMVFRELFSKGDGA